MLESWTPGHFDKDLRPGIAYRRCIKSRNSMVVMGTSQTQRQPGRGAEPSGFRPAEVHKLPRTLSNSQPSSKDGVSTSKTSTPRLPRLLGSLPKSVTISDAGNIEDMLLSSPEHSASLRPGEGNGKTVFPTLESPRPQPDLPESLPLWERDLSHQEVKTLSRRIPNTSANGPSVSEGFWRSMKFTPGEMDLKYNRNQNCYSPRRPHQVLSTKTQPKRTNLPMTKAKSSPSLYSQANPPPPKRIPILPTGPSSVPDLKEATKHNQQVYDKFAREQTDMEEDPDRLNMGHIFHALQDQISGTYRERDLSPRRQESRYGAPKNATAVQMALRASRRYRHPEKASANLPMSPQKGTDMVAIQSTKLSGVERALKNSSTYEIQQRNKKNREATQSDIRRYHATHGNASVSRSMSLYALSLPLEAEPYSLHGLMKKRAATFHQQKLTDSGDDQDWRMNMSPADWVKLLKANPGDPIFKRLGIEKETNNKNESKLVTAGPIRLPTIEDSASDTGSFVSEAPVSVRTPRCGSADLRSRSRENILQDMENRDRSPPKTPVPFNSPETSPRGERSSEDEGVCEDIDEENWTRHGNGIPVHNIDLHDYNEKGNECPNVNHGDHTDWPTKTTPRSDVIKPSLSKHTSDGSQGPLKPSKRVVIVVPTKDIQNS